MPKRAPKRARDDDLKKNEEAPAAASSLMTALMRRGTVSVLEALEVELPEVLKTEVIGKHLPLDSTLNLAQVSKWCRDAVWSPEAVHDWTWNKRYNSTIHWQDHATDYPLETAVRSGNLPAIKAMIEEGSQDVNAQSEYFWGSFRWYTPLHLAALYGQPKVMRLLVEAGADVDAYDSRGNTPLLLAAEQRRTDVVMELIRLGGDVNKKKRPRFCRDCDPARFCTPLHAAVLRMDMGSVVALLTAGADVNAVVDGNYLMKTPDCQWWHSSSEEKEHLRNGCFTPLDILGFKCRRSYSSLGVTYDDYVRYLQAFRKASVCNKRFNLSENLTAFSALDSEDTKHGAELRRDAPRPNVYDAGYYWFQSLVSMNLILTQAGAKFYEDIKQDDDTGKRCKQTN